MVVANIRGAGEWASPLADEAPTRAAPISWVKILNPAYTQMRGRKEMFEAFRERRETVLPNLTPETPR